MDAEKQKKLKKWFWGIILVPIGLLAVMLLLVSLFAEIPSFEELEDPDSNLATLLISEDGRTFSTYHLENRSYVKFEDLPKSLIDAFL